MAGAADESVTTPQPEAQKSAKVYAARHCLVIEPEAALQHNYGAALVTAGFSVIASHSVTAVITDEGLLNIDLPAVVLMAANDYAEYHEPRLQRFRQQLLALRKRWPLSSLIVLADGTPSRWLNALAVDDLLPKIAPLTTIVARCRQAAMRFSRRQPDIEQPWRVLCGEVEEQADAGLLRFSGVRPRLTLSEYAVFSYLLEANGECRSYAALSKTVGYPADPISLMALLQALQLRCADTYADIVELEHIPHYGYQLKLLAGQPASDNTKPLAEPLAAEPLF